MECTWVATAALRAVLQVVELEELRGAAGQANRRAKPLSVNPANGLQADSDTRSA